MQSPASQHRRGELAASVPGVVIGSEDPLARRRVALDLDAFRALGADVGETVIVECANGDVVPGSPPRRLEASAR